GRLAGRIRRQQRRPLLAVRRPDGRLYVEEQLLDGQRLVESVGGLLLTRSGPHVRHEEHTTTDEEEERPLHDSAQAAGRAGGAWGPRAGTPATKRGAGPVLELDARWRRWGYGI